MNCCLKKVGNVAFVVVPGETLDASNSKDFRKSVKPILSDHNEVVLDLSEKRFVDSSGCGALLSCLRTLNAKGGDLKLCGVSKQVRALFELIRMHRVVEIYNTREEALNSFDD